MDRDAYNQFLLAAGGEFLRMTGTLFEKKLAARGVENIDGAPAALLKEVLREAAFETAGRNPKADLRLIGRLVDVIFRADMQGALRRMLDLVNKHYDAFMPAIGKDAALLMAFYGVPVAPMDKETFRMMGTPSNDLDEVAAMFDRAKTALVGYSTCEAQFYVLVADCGDTVARLIDANEQMARIKFLFERDDAPLPKRDHVPFRRTFGLFRRGPGEELASFSYLDPRPDWGSLMFYAGWMEDGQPKGCAGGGYKFVPLHLLHAFLQMPDAFSFVRGDRKPVPETAH